MDAFKQFLRYYWLHLLATVIFAACVWRYVALAEWEARFEEIALAGFGFVSVVAADEVAEWTGRYGWTRQRWWQQPIWYVRGAGVLCLIVGAAQILGS
ncbi:MAG: hypothetical protein IIA67_08650 [Planctomycetes bacterium]|nr:hypothetical protein [Planctomycetota bacterium]